VDKTKTMRNGFEEKIALVSGEGLYSRDIEVLQINVGLRCNQVCLHCHVEASPLRTEVMPKETMERVLDVADAIRPEWIDLTGGAPELHPDFRDFVKSLRNAGHQVQVRTNLTVMLEPGMEHLPEFLREQQVRLVASLPCYLEENVRAQRGPKTYEKSIESIRRLNALGYGTESGLPLNLIYNPGGAFLPPEQSRLESDYRRELSRRFGIVFSRLLTITNMPIGRFWTSLRRSREDRKYIHLLREAFNPGTLDGLMCRHQISVGWDGRIYDCDFNLALGAPVNHGAPNRIERFERSALEKRRIVTGDHCFGCTAGCGSSCGGSLV